MDWLDVERLAMDRSGWKKLMNERMDHLGVYERQLAMVTIGVMVRKGLRGERGQ